MIVEMIIALIGLLLSLLLFGRVRILKASQAAHSTNTNKVTVIIPARNEEKNLPLLLEDLMQQTAPLCEIICVDDGSSDGTAAAARTFGVKTITVNEKPDGWMGKSYACQRGADEARGNLYLFLDADVRLFPGALTALISMYEKTGHVISVQPYHATKRVYEQFSMFFNIIQVAANGLGLPFFTVNVGLYGPVILIRKEVYDAIGGHEAVKESITEDLALGEALKGHGYAFDLYQGGRDISFRMYGSGLKSLLEGWTKNYATGALKMPFILLLVVFVWVAACMSPPYHLFTLAFMPSQPILWIYAALYLSWVLTLWRITRPIGSFSVLSVIFYPVFLLFFIGIFIVSLFKKLFGLPVTWKDRKIVVRR